MIAPIIEIKIATIIFQMTHSQRLYPIIVRAKRLPEFLKNFEEFPTDFSQIAITIQSFLVTL